MVNMAIVTRYNLIFIFVYPRRICLGIYIKGSGSYPATVRRCGEGFEARFVDLPDCVVIGSSAIEAERRAQAALTAYADVARRHAGAMPPPSTVKDASNIRDNYIAYIKFMAPEDVILPKI